MKRKIHQQKKKFIQTNSRLFGTTTMNSNYFDIMFSGHRAHTNTRKSNIDKWLFCSAVVAQTEPIKTIDIFVKKFCRVAVPTRKSIANFNQTNYFRFSIKKFPISLLVNPNRSPLTDSIVRVHILNAVISSINGHLLIRSTFLIHKINFLSCLGSSFIRIKRARHQCLSNAVKVNKMNEFYIVQYGVCIGVFYSQY